MKKPWRSNERGERKKGLFSFFLSSEASSGWCHFSFASYFHVLNGLKKTYAPIIIILCCCCGHSHANASDLQKQQQCQLLCVSPMKRSQGLPSFHAQNALLDIPDPRSLLKSHFSPGTFEPPLFAFVITFSFHSLWGEKVGEVFFLSLFAPGFSLSLSLSLSLLQWPRLHPVERARTKKGP